MSKSSGTCDVSRKAFPISFNSSSATAGKVASIMRTGHEDPFPSGAMALLQRLPRRAFSLAAMAVAAGRGRPHSLAQAAAKRALSDGGGSRGSARSGERRGQRGLVRAAAMLGGLGLSGFSLFTSQAEKEKEEDTEEKQKEPTQEDTIILLLKKAKLSIMKGELQEAEKLLHEAARLSHESANSAAVIYTYDMMANLAFMRGHLDQAEKLFKATMSFLLAGGMKQEDNAILEISLKLASIYAAQNQDKLARAGYQFCILTLEEKLANQKSTTADVLSEEEKVNTHLLLGMTLDSYARYLLAHSQAAAAQKMYERALKISTEFQGEKHPQTVVLMSDLATALDSQGLYEEAYVQAKRASELAQQTEHPEAHIILNNLAGILKHKDDYAQARQIYKKALQQAEKAGDEASVRYIQKELSELTKQRKR